MLDRESLVLEKVSRERTLGCETGNALQNIRFSGTFGIVIYLYPSLLQVEETNIKTGVRKLFYSIKRQTI